MAKRSIECPKEQWTTIISNFATGMPATFQVRLNAKNGGEVAGIYLEKRYLWIFPQSPTSGQLSAEMVFERYWINAIYWVKIFPKTDLIAEIH